MDNTALSRAIPDHVLPPPGGHSPEMRQAVEKMSALQWPDVLPTSNAGWDAIYNPDPDATRARIRNLLARLDLQLEEISCGGVHCFRIEPAGGGAADGPVLVNLHGGGYVLGAGEVGINEAVLVAGTTRYTIIAVDYRMPPEHPFPAPVDDTMAAWLDVTQRFAGRPLGLFGTSAGAALALKLVQRLIAEAGPLPTAIVAGTPWADLTETGDSYFTNRYADPMVYTGLLDVMARQYANGLSLDDPRISPIYGSFEGFPPTLLLAGTRDLFLSNTIRVDRKIRDAGGSSEVIIYEGQSHGQYALDIAVPETRTTLSDVAKFWARQFG